LVSGIKKSKIENIVFFPNSGEAIFEEMKRQGYLPKNHIFTNNMEEAVKFARKFTISGFICLLSTASPSYSVWKNFEEKGDLFKQFIKKYSTSF
jgi:UDP-N-acetylmuramoylalanine--D-glutamate ligase